MYYKAKHRLAAQPSPLRVRVAGAAVVASAALVTGVSMSAPAQAAGSVWDAVAACESSGNWAIQTGNGYYGGLQFSASTWNAFGGNRYASTANKASKSVQIAIAQRVLAVQGPGAWPACSKRAGLTKANGGVAAPVRAPAPVRVVTVVSRSTTRKALPAKGKLAVDGAMGPMTTAAIQRWIGTTPDGAFGPQSAKALQRKVGATPDGAIGRLTIAALQTKIGARHDGAGYLNSPTVMKVQAYLNSH